ncbi:MAG: histidine phosphatase family protein [Acidocella sp. 20-57-95]|nr:MAG: histidine phosphatase family protein [Acidocella sp. 20-57-95]OYV59580.1 MAG: histidine phosphatase family protein [Acidocella sp. 21-58-7]HQT63600.1 histidine phosphatase family protein [Acidocella sp.]HQU04905.1 histidine phosphatase family protein [Acidocella sp.]
MPLPATPFWFLRHGETDYNAQGLSQGALDISLNAAGRAQAEAAGALLVGKGIIGIVSSPMLRTRETTALVNQHLNLPVTYDEGLREVIFGGMEGKPLTPWFADWMAGTYTPEGAESFADITERVRATLTPLLALPGPLLIVAHGGVFRALRGLLGLTLQGLTPNAQPLFCNPGAQGWTITAETLDGAAHEV